MGANLFRPTGAFVRRTMAFFLTLLTVVPTVTALSKGVQHNRLHKCTITCRIMDFSGLAVNSFWDRFTSGVTPMKIHLRIYWPIVSFANLSKAVIGTLSMHFSAFFILPLQWYTTLKIILNIALFVLHI